MSGRLPRDKHIWPIFELVLDPDGAHLREAENYIGEDGSMSARHVAAEEYELYIHDEFTPGGILVGSTSLTNLVSRVDAIEAEMPDDFSTVSGQIITFASGATLTVPTGSSISGTVITTSDGTSFDVASVDTDTSGTVNAAGVISFPDGSTLDTSTIDTDTDTFATISGQTITFAGGATKDIPVGSTIVGNIITTSDGNTVDLNTFAADDQGLTSTDNSVVITTDANDNHNITNPNPLIDPGSSSARASATSNAISMGKTPDQHKAFETAYGHTAGENAVGDSTVHVGYGAGFGALDGDNSVNVGTGTSHSTTKSTGTVAIGYNANSYSGETVNSIAMGYLTASNMAKANRAISLGAVTGYFAQDVYYSFLAGSRTGYQATSVYNSFLFGTNVLTASNVTDTIFIGGKGYGNLTINKATLVGSGAGFVSAAVGAPVPGTLTAANEITITGHGFTVGEYVLGYLTNTNRLPTTAYGYLVIDANTIQTVDVPVITTTIGTAVTFDLSAISSSHENSVAIGNSAKIAKSNQVVLGNSAITEVTSAGDAYFNGTFYASDKRLKRAVKPLTGALDILNALAVSRFKWNFEAPEMIVTPATTEEVEITPAEIAMEADENGRETGKIKVLKPAKTEQVKVPATTFVPGREKNTRQIGVIAQDVEKVLPEAVKTRGGIKTVDYSKLNVIAIAAINELAAQNKSLEERLAKLEKSTS